MLRVSRQTVLRLCREGKIRCERSPAGQFRPTLRDLADYLDSLLVAADSQAA